MSQSNHPPNYMDGVPVKISERYKPPPKVSLPQVVINRLTNPYGAVGSLNYDFNLERNVQTKICEWREVRQREHSIRQERKRLRDEERERQIEENRKKMLTEVSYPSTEDLSSDDGEEEISPLNTTATTSTMASAEPIPVVATNKFVESYNTRPGHFSPPNCFDTILTPTIVPGSGFRESNATNTPKMQTTSITSTNQQPIDKVHTPFHYADFENDTSSPFDNMELKTINDLDILAQVLKFSAKLNSNDVIVDDQEHKLSSTTTATNTTTDAGGKQKSLNDEHEQHINENSNEIRVVNEIVNNHNLEHLNNYYNVYYQQQPQQVNQPGHQHHHPTYTNYYQTNTNYNQMNENYASNMNYNNCEQLTTNTIHQLQQHHNNIPVTQHQLHSTMHCQPVVLNNVMPESKYYYNRNYAVDYVYKGLDDKTPSSNNIMSKMAVRNDSGIITTNTQAILPIIQQQQSSSKSKSVPDIMKELNDELKNSERKRIRNNSQTITSPVDEYPPSNGGASSFLPPEKRNVERDDDQDLYNTLPYSLKKMSKNISSMGFPLGRVSRVAKLFGNDDKKIVEHLIPLGELLDLGFDETKISEALIKYNNNKDKALDFLIS